MSAVRPDRAGDPMPIGRIRMRWETYGPGVVGGLECRALFDEIDRLAARLAAAELALAIYGAHRSECLVMAFAPDDVDCTCGLERHRVALAAARESRDAAGEGSI